MGFSLNDAAAPFTFGSSELLPGGRASLFGGSKTTSQVPLMTPQQIEAQNALLDFARTGKLADGFQAGEAVPLGYGDFRTTGAEDQGLSSLQQLLSAGVNPNFTAADKALSGILDPAAAANGVQDQFKPFVAQTQRQIGQSQAALKRSAGFAGGLYSTNTIKGLGDIQAQGNNTLTSQLASLTNASLDRRLQAIPIASNLAGAEQNSALASIDASQKYGDLTRSLNDASIKARDAELLRRRQELQLPIGALESVAGDSAQFGVPSVTTSPYQQLLGMAGTIGGTALGAYLGGPTGAVVGANVGGKLGNSAGSSYANNNATA